MTETEPPAAVRSDNGRAPTWWIYQGSGEPREGFDLADVLPEPPGWRSFDGGPAVSPPPDDGRETTRRLGVGGRLEPGQIDPNEVDMVNAALYLRRPLLVTGKPGTGKSSLAYRIARELGIGPVLRWPITSKSTLTEGLYSYDPIGRAQAAAARRAKAGPGESVAEPNVGDYVRLGPLGTALLPYAKPRVLLVDELDKSDIDLPNDLLNVFEEGEFQIPELVRMARHQQEVQVLTADSGVAATIRDGSVTCRAFPIVVMTSNGEREFPAPFLRRALRHEMRDPGREQLAGMVAAHFRDRGGHDDSQTRELIRSFLRRSSDSGGLAADQLLNSVYLATSGAYDPTDGSWTRLVDAIWRRLTVDDSG